MQEESLIELAEDICNLSLSRGADDAIVNAIRNDTRQIRFSESRVDIFNRWRDVYYVLFLARKGSVVSTLIKGRGDMEEAVSAAIRTAEIAPPSSDYYGIAARSSAKNHVVPEKLAPDSKLSKLVLDGIDRAMSDGALSSTGTLYNENSFHYLHSSSGIRKKQSMSSYYFSIRCFRGEGESGHAVTSSLSLSKFRPERAASKAAHFASLMRKPENGSEGKFDTLLDPMVTATLVSEIGRMASAYSVMSGFSCLAGRIGKKVASDAVTLEDDATRPLYGRRYFDDEGVATRRTGIIRHGILRSYLHNTSTAHRFRKHSTGNAGLISPEPFSLSLSPGKVEVEDMMREMDSGLYINNVWYTRYQNYARGDFSTIPRDAIFEIRNGEIRRCIRNIRITENLLRVFRNAVRLSREREHINWWVESSVPCTVPAMQVKGMKITRSTDS